MEKIATNDLRSRMIAKSQSKDVSASLMSNQAEIEENTPTPNIPKPPDPESSKGNEAAQEKSLVPVEATSTEGGQEKALTKQDQPDFHLDHAERLDPQKFPNPPVGETKYFPTTIQNVTFLLNGYGIKVKYNVIKKEPEIIVPGLACSLDNASSSKMTQIKSLARQNGLSTTGLEDMILAIADRNQFNPVATWIKSKPWDGEDRLQKFYDTLTEREDYPTYLKEILVKRWMISAIAAIFMPQGFKCRGVLTLQGKQGAGKTSWFRSLVPDNQLRESVLKLDQRMDAGDKDCIIAAATHWIVELGELEGSFSRNMDRLKGFLTNDIDKVRIPYARCASVFPRRTVFSASVNETRFLVDSTGNSRWWTIPVTSINYQHQLEMQQIWAQFLVEYENGEQWWLTTEEEDLLEALNQDHRVVSVIEERVLPVLDLSRKNEDGLPAMTATELLIKLGFKHATNPQAKECGSILRHHLGEPKKIKGIMKWRIPIAKQPDFTKIDEF